MAAIHQNLASGKWAQMTLSQQLANVGSEFMRWQIQKNPELKQAAQERMLELLDLTIQSRPSKELRCLREILFDPQYSDQIKKYFLEFGLSARK